MTILLLLASLSWGQSTGTVSLQTQLEISNLGKAVKSLESGKPVITGEPRFINGICFDSAGTDCQTSSASGGSGLVSNSSGTYYNASSTVTSPGINTQYADNVVKAWVVFIGSATAQIQAQFNVQSVARTAAGKYTVTFKRAFSGPGAYACSCLAMRDPAVSTGGNISCNYGDTAPTTTAITLITNRNDQVGIEDPSTVSVICVGLQ